MSGSVNDQLAAQLDFYWEAMFRPRLEGLTDDEYLWEPVEGCWTVRPDERGRLTVDHAWPPPDPPPFTTIAWRLCHIAGPVFGMRVEKHFGSGTYDPEAVDWPGTASGAIAFVEDAYARWRQGVRSLGDDGLWRPVGQAEGAYAAEPYIALVLHINREVFHHAAEVALLRDLYRDRERTDVRSV